MKSWTARELKVLAQDGWMVKHQVGSHVQLVHPTKPGKVTVPNHKGDLDRQTVKSIARQSGLDLEEP